MAGYATISKATGYGIDPATVELWDKRDVGDSEYPQIIVIGSDESEIRSASNTGRLLHMEMEVHVDLYNTYNRTDFPNSMTQAIESHIADMKKVAYADPQWGGDAINTTSLSISPDDELEPLAEIFIRLTMTIQYRQNRSDPTLRV